MNISSIKTHMYCPMKLYIQTHVDSNENIDYQLAVETKKLKIDIQDLIQKNMRKIKKTCPFQKLKTDYLKTSIITLKAMPNPLWKSI